MAVLLKREEPLPLGDASAGLSLTLEELAEFDGRELPGTNGQRAAILLAIKGRIYDVSAGHAFYGPGRHYHKLTGRDATRAFCTGCLEPDCLISTTAGLTDAQIKEADRWIELCTRPPARSLHALTPNANPRARLKVSSIAWPPLHSDEHHDKYKLVGQIREPFHDHTDVGNQEAGGGSGESDDWEQEQVERALQAERSKKHRPFRPR